ncbi:MAG: SGNH/GDSL hydrolase family protein [Paenisporosarcina sp.]
MKGLDSKNKKIVWRIGSILILLLLVASVYFLNQDNKTSTNLEVTSIVKPKPSIKEMKLVEPTSPEWLFTNGPWKQIEDPEIGTVMKGWMMSNDTMHFGRRVKIETDSPFAVLKQRGIGGTLTVFVDGEPAVEKDLDSNGKLSEIQLYENKTGWHEIEIVHSSFSELDGLLIEKDASVRKPADPKKKLVVIGHSYTEGYGSSNKALKSFAGLIGDKLNVESINQGIGRTDLNVSYPASRKNSGLERVKTDVIDLKPEFVLMAYGYNAMTIEIDQYQSNYLTFLNTIHEALPETKVFASGIISVAHYSDEYLQPRNQAIKKACESTPNCTYIDLENKWNDTNYTKYISPDGVHPNDEGHAFLAEEYAKVIKTAISN